MLDEKNKISVKFKWIAFILLALSSIVLLFVGIIKVNVYGGNFEKVGEDNFTRVTEALEEEYEDETVCPVEFKNENGDILTVNYTFEEWEKLPTSATVKGVIYSDGDIRVCFLVEPTAGELKKAVKDLNAAENADTFNISLALLFLAAALLTVTLFNEAFTRYEQIWFISIITLASLFAIIFPESEINGVNGIVIALLYLLDTFLNILCELLISKQSKWNFIVSVFVEFTEIAICIVLAYRFATLASTLFFWLPCDIISFVNWLKHPDDEKEELTVVRSLKGWQELLIILGIAVWTVGVGYLLTFIDIGSELFSGNEILKNAVCYLDACVSAVGVVNGIFILFRLKEQWIAWYLSAGIELVINVLSGQITLIPLKIGYLTNTTYGYIKWNKYIKGKGENKND